MTYSTREISNDTGKPVFLYDFRLGTKHWRYTSADRDVTLSGTTWAAEAISDAGYTQGGSDQNDLTLTCQTNNAVAVLFKSAKPSGKMWLSIWAWHEGDAETERQLQWMGTVTNSVFEDRATASLLCRSIAGTYDRNGLRLAWQRQCPHVLYGIGCYVPKEEHDYPRTIATLTGTNFTCTAHSEPEEGSFSGGFVEWADGDGNMQRRGIELQNGNDFLVMGTTQGMTVGLAVTCYPGCARTTTNCKLFGDAPRGNLDNYGGIPHLPGKSPFDGTPVF